MPKYLIVTDEDSWPENADSLEALIKALKDDDAEVFPLVKQIYEMKDVTPTNLKELQEDHAKAHVNSAEETPVSDKPLPMWWERNPRRN